MTRRVSLYAQRDDGLFPRKRRKVPLSARQRCIALSMTVSNMGCKSSGELAIARSTEDLSAEEPGHRALYRLLSNLVGRYVDAFDEEPLPISVAERAYDRLLELLGSVDLRATADRRLADIDRVAASDLYH